MLRGFEEMPTIRIARLIMKRNRLTVAEQRELQTRMERKQMKDFMTVRTTATAAEFNHRLD